MSTSYAVVKCTTGKLVVHSNAERDFAPGLPLRDRPTSLVTSQGHRPPDSVYGENDVDSWTD